MGTRRAVTKSSGSQEPKALDPLIEKGLPISPEAEKAVLGAVLLDNYAYEIVSEMLNAEDFAVDANRRIYQRMVALRDKTPAMPIDSTTLTNELLASKELEIIGGFSYLSSLTDGLPRAVNSEHYARIVKDKSTLRRLIHTAHDIFQEGLDGAYGIGEENSRDAFTTFLDRAESSIMAVRPACRTGLICVSEIVPSRRVKSNKPRGVSTGFKTIDEKMACGGWANKELSFILARTSHGKTSMMLNQAYCQAVAGNVVAIFSLETAKEQLVDRLCCQLSGVSLFKQMHDMLNSWEDDLIEDARKEVEKLPLHINDASGLNASEVNAQVRRLKRDVGQVDIVWGDFLRLLKHLPGKWGTTNDAVAETVTTLKRGAQEMACPFVWLSQIGRFQTDKKNGKPEPPPTISDARDCGEIENQSYTMVGLYRLDQAMKMVDPNWCKNGEAQFDLLKDKDGPCGTIPLHFAGSSMNFAEIGSTSPAPSVGQRSLPK